MTTAAVAEAIYRLEHEIKQNVHEAECLLYGTAHYDELFSGKMAAALAHTNIAMLKRAELDALRAG